MTSKNPLLLLFIMLPLTSFAHEGHGFYHGYELGHYLISPMHAFPVVLVAILGIWMYAKREKRQRTKL